MTGSIASAAVLLAALAAAPALAQEAATPDSAAPADSAAVDSLAADSLLADSAGAGEAVGGVPSLEGYRRIAILSRDMAPGVPGYETSVEVHRGAEGAQVLRFLTRGTPWALVVRPARAADSYTLRDFDCSGGFTEELEAGTPLTIPDCALPSTPAPAVDEDD